MHALLLDRLQGEFELLASATSVDAALAAARGAAATDRILIDTDSLPQDPATVIAKLALLGPAPILALSSAAAPGSATASALLRAGATALVAKPAGPLPLIWEGEDGAPLVQTLREALTR
ncbi:response regulator [Elstera litoralis]|uniref:hypothetical protein n=1 Tax=Elstera litoralis TaxID=552518 RepID=UPI0012EEDC3D|nr:hypothetical protein [Elstera litoralis]